jgi:hypothetical protein
MAATMALQLGKKPKQQEVAGSEEKKRSLAIGRQHREREKAPSAQILEKDYMWHC